MKMNKGILFIMSGPSGSGKTTLYQEILKKKQYKDKLIKTVSVTTRLKRKGELNGRDYLFVSKKMFRYKQKAGHFLESMRIFSDYYGTPRKAVYYYLKKGISVLLCIDVKGANAVLRQFPDAVTIFIQTPSFTELKRRLINRGSEDKSTLKSRLNTAKKELKSAKKYQHIVINDSVEKAIHQLVTIFNQKLLSTGISSVS